MRMITDLHCHLLPYLDDGAKDWATALRMVQMAAISGVGRIVCTPHCSFGDPGLGKRIQAILGYTDSLDRALTAHKVPVRVFSGAELLWAGSFPNMDLLSSLTLAGSRYLLLEFRFGERLSRMDHALSRLQNMGITPVIAHPERYVAVQREPSNLGEWFRAGWVIQLDKGSVVGDYGRNAYNAAAWALEHGFVHVVSSDAHNTHTRTPNFRRVEKLLSERFSPRYAELLLRRNPGRVVENLELVR